MLVNELMTKCRVIGFADVRHRGCQAMHSAAASLPDLTFAPSNGP